MNILRTGRRYWQKRFQRARFKDFGGLAADIGKSGLRELIFGILGGLAVDMGKNGLREWLRKCLEARICAQAQCFRVAAKLCESGFVHRRGVFEPVHVGFVGRRGVFESFFEPK